MKKLLGIVVLGLFLITPSLADDISDFEIEGISIGDSALDYFSEEQIKGKKVNSSFGFGDGQSSKRFFDIISKTEIWDINLQKYFIEMDEKN